jgi:hypothetical protein
MMQLISGSLHIDNKIGDEGAKVLGESLKENKTLTLLNVGGGGRSNSK